MSIPLNLTLMIELNKGMCTACGMMQQDTIEVCVGHAESSDTHAICLGCLYERRLVEAPLMIEQPEAPKGRRPPTRNDRKLATSREVQLAQSIGGRRQPASGAMPHAKGDVRLHGRWRLDDKFTRSQQFTLTRGLISKARSECAFGEEMAITVGFLNKLTDRSEDEVVIIERRKFEEVVRAEVDR
jgi:hypothetical protein